MKPEQIIKIIIDILMTTVLLLLMAYSLVGEAAHEWLGIGMFVLFFLHHILNSRWTFAVLKGRYTPFRIFQTLLVVLASLSMMGSMISGIILSRHALSFLPISGGQSFARTLHMISAYWGFIVISLHLGLHWNRMMAMAGRMVSKPSALRKWIARAAGVLFAGYGIFAFVKREIGSYMFLKLQFAFFDPGEPLILFLLDYIAVMGLLVWIGHYVAKGLKTLSR